MPSDPDQIAERALMNAIMHDVGALDGIVVHRNSVGGVQYGNAHIKYGVGGKGAPDLMLEVEIKTSIAVPMSASRQIATLYCVLWVECKTATGRASKEQTAWHLAARKRGRPCIVARCVDDVRAAISCVRKGMVTVYDRSKGVEVCDGE